MQWHKFSQSNRNFQSTDPNPVLGRTFYGLVREPVKLFIYYLPSGGSGCVWAAAKFTSSSQENCHYNQVEGRDIRTEGQRYGHKETKRHRVTYRDKAEYMKAHRMPQRSHSTGLVQDCLEILAPDEILKVPFIFIQILEVVLLLLSFLRIYTSVVLVTTTISLSASKLTSTSKQNWPGWRGWPQGDAIDGGEGPCLRLPITRWQKYAGFSASAFRTIDIPV